MNKLILVVVWIGLLASCKSSDSPAPTAASTQLNIYVGGMEVNASGKKVATLWKNDTATALTDGLNNAEIIAMTAAGNDIYALGYEEVASDKTLIKYWKNGVATTLMDGTHITLFNSMA